MLKFKTVQMVDLEDWDDLVEKTYGKIYSFQQQDGCQSRGTYPITIPDHPEDYENETIPEDINGDEMGVSFATWLAHDPKEWNGPAEDADYIERFWHRIFYPNIQMVANDLHAKGLIPAGKYIIDIDW
jgi:hypothetical protein